MKTLQRQNTKREIVKKVRFQKGAATTIQQQELQQHNKANIENPVSFDSKLVTVAPPAPANSESLDSNVVEEEANDNKKCDAITLSLTESDNL
jgi:hypothetical protein